ncbi:hypothetical protein [Paraburkholderia sp. CI3]|uniref:hypothetical protein n=1 Tax=Paraburkholderia sp. CI3 TaxID=2991060 RepID=UPI003D220D17
MKNFHDLIAAKYERATSILTSNLDFSEMGRRVPRLPHPRRLPNRAKNRILEAVRICAFCAFLLAPLRRPVTLGVKRAQPAREGGIEARLPLDSASRRSGAGRRQLKSAPGFPRERLK